MEIALVNPVSAQPGNLNWDVPSRKYRRQGSLIEIQQAACRILLIFVQMGVRSP
jgi:hypothetical protein